MIDRQIDRQKDRHVLVEIFLCILSLLTIKEEGY